MPNSKKEPVKAEDIPKLLKAGICCDVHESQITQLTSDVSDLKKEMKRNTEVTEQVRDILTSFRIFTAIAKWLTILLGLISAVYHGWDIWSHKK